MLSFTKGLQELLRQAPKNKGPAQRRPGLFNFNPAATYSPIRRPYSTIGAEGLNDRVRDGIGCDTSAIATGSSSAVINGRLLRYARIRSLQRNCLNTSALADRRKPRIHRISGGLKT